MICGVVILPLISKVGSGAADDGAAAIFLNCGKLKKTYSQKYVVMIGDLQFLRFSRKFLQQIFYFAEM
jgi:hypothetical protein